MMDVFCSRRACDKGERGEVRDDDDKEESEAGDEKRKPEDSEARKDI